jgi:hypothetical protein
MWGLRRLHKFHWELDQLESHWHFSECPQQQRGAWHNHTSSAASSFEFRYGKQRDPEHNAQHTSFRHSGNASSERSARANSGSHAGRPSCGSSAGG